ncbi:Cadmium-induced protein CadI [compost metagenome]
MVLAAKQRLEDAGLLTLDEMATNCCYAIQDKIWVTDPDGHQWEIFHVIQGDVDPVENQDATCCAPGMSCGTTEAPVVALEVM